ncbi:MAG TPA: Smr/MutS family protein [Ramlibacter sp.]|nr:Smr/MutS family protein [Ramlibacter sp.]
MKAKSLQDLEAMRSHLAERQRLAKEEAAARAAAQKKREAEQNLFQRAAGAVQPLPSHGRVHHLPEPPAPIPAQRQLDDQRVLKESISDEFDASTLLEVDEAMSFRRPGIGIDVARKLRRGHWSIQREIDLHGLRTDDAREALGAFLRDAVKQGLRCVRVVHGKGLGSPGKTPVLKGKVHGWLVQKNEVLAYVQARGDEGGAGAVVVLLKPAG